MWESSSNNDSFSFSVTLFFCNSETENGCGQSTMCRDACHTITYYVLQTHTVTSGSGTLEHESLGGTSFQAYIPIGTQKGRLKKTDNTLKTVTLTCIYRD